MRISVLAGLAVVTAGGVFMAGVTLGHQGDDDSASAALQKSSVVSAAPDSPATAAPADSPAASAYAPYVALGDSYTAGVGIPARTGTPAGCARSERNYPALVAGDLGLSAAGFRDVSCGGATIADLSGSQSTDDGTNSAQLSALSPATRLVTLGIGGNDIGFTSLIKNCVKAGILSFATSGNPHTDGAPCREQYVTGRTDTVRQKIDAAGHRLASTLTDIARRAPQARVYVVGYPAILPATSSTCGREMGLAPGDVTFLHQELQQLNTMLRRQASAAGAGYVDTYTPSTGHDACSAWSTRWIEPMIPLSPAAPVHPNERGERGMADAVLQTLKGS